MNNFNDRIFLMLTLKDKELLNYYLKTIALLIGLSFYNLIGVFIGTPRLISYWSILIAVLIVSVFFLIVRGHRLPIQWELLDRVDKEVKEPAKPKQSTAIVEEAVVATSVASLVPSNDEIELVEDEEQEFDFADNLMSLYKTGTPEELSDVAVNGITQKVRRMNIR